MEFKKHIGPPDHPFKLFRAYRKTDLFCDTDLEPYQQLECGSELAGVIALGLLDPSVAVDEADIANNLEDPTWWTGLMDASPVTAFLLLNTRGERGPGTPTEEDGFGLQSVERTGDDNELTFDIQGVMKNRDFWAKANKRKKWDFVYLTAQKDSNGNFAAFYVQNASIYASLNVPKSIKTRKFYGASVKWSTDMTPELPFFAPASIFTLSE